VFSRSQKTYPLYEDCTAGTAIEDYQDYLL